MSWCAEVNLLFMLRGRVFKLVQFISAVVEKPSEIALGLQVRRQTMISITGAAHMLTH